MEEGCEFSPEGFVAPSASPACKVLILLHREADQEKEERKQLSKKGHSGVTPHTRNYSGKALD